jgi:hypothetical protein
MRKALLLAAFLSGCALSPQKETLAPKYCEPIPIIHPAPPRVVQLQSIEFYVVSEKNLDEFLQEHKVFYAITPNGYERLSNNIQELRRYIREVQNIVLFYRKIDEAGN